MGNYLKELEQDNQAMAQEIDALRRDGRDKEEESLEKA